MNRTLDSASQSCTIPMSEYICRPISMWDVLDSSRMDLTRIFHLFEFLKIYPTDVPNVIGLVSGILF